MDRSIFRLMHELQNGESMSQEQMPLYVQIREHLLEIIESEQMNPEKKLPTEKELAEKFSVSRITARKAFEQLEQAGIISRVPGRGTFITPREKWGNISDRNKPMQENKLIGLIVSTMDTPFRINLIIAIEKALSDAGCQMMFGVSNNDTELENAIIDRMLSSGVHGIILYPATVMYYGENILKLSINKFPFVLVDRYLSGIDICSVSSDNLQGGRLMGEYLIRKGHKNVIIISPTPQKDSIIADRITGFRNAMAAGGLSQMYDYGIFDIEEGSVINASIVYERCVARIQKYILEHAEVTAVFCLQSNIAMCAYKAIREVDRNIEVTSFDDIREYEWAEHYPIAHVKYSEHIMGQTAVKKVLKQINNESAQNIVLPCTMVEPDANKY